jgi:hypothetical protein
MSPKDTPGSVAMSPYSPPKYSCTIVPAGSLPARCHARVVRNAFGS